MVLNTKYVDCADINSPDHYLRLVDLIHKNPREKDFLITSSLKGLDGNKTSRVFGMRFWPLLKEEEKYNLVDRGEDEVEEIEEENNNNFIGREEKMIANELQKEKKFKDLYKEDGLYLITGATGGMGAALARDLFHKGILFFENYCYFLISL